jgi:hypothetical protein
LGKNTKTYIKQLNFDQFFVKCAADSPLVSAARFGEISPLGKKLPNKKRTNLYNFLSNVRLF